MLQQTQVDRVIPKFNVFIEGYPTIHKLAHASLTDVLALWQGLGYNRRAKSLKEAAEIVVRNHQGHLPSSPDALVALPGIGPATAASIAAFAFNAPTIFLETNIRTVFIYHFFPNTASLVPDTTLIPVAEALLDRKNPRKWYSALMDYGTELKKKVGNVSRKSSLYKKQSPFQGSRRQLRGQIVKHLLTIGPCTPRKLARVVGADIKELSSVLLLLQKDQMIKKTGQKVSIH